MVENLPPNADRWVTRADAADLLGLTRPRITQLAAQAAYAPARHPDPNDKRLAWPLFGIIRSCTRDPQQDAARARAQAETAAPSAPVPAERSSPPDPRAFTGTLPLAPPAPRGQPSLDADPDPVVVIGGFADAQTQLKRAQAALAEVKLAEQTGQLVRAAGVRSAAVTVGAKLGAAIDRGLTGRAEAICTELGTELSDTRRVMRAIARDLRTDLKHLLDSLAAAAVPADIDATADDRNSTTLANGQSVVPIGPRDSAGRGAATAG